MPPKKKFKAAHRIDAAGVLQAAKVGDWNAFRSSVLKHKKTLSFQNFNELPPGRNFGVVHQIAYHRNTDALSFLLQHHPRVDLKLPTKDGRSALEVSLDEDEGTVHAGFVDYLKERLMIQTHHELVNKALNGNFDALFEQLEEERNHDAADEETPNPVTVDTLNAIPPGRSWGVIHQISYWGDISALERLLQTFSTLNLELETNEEAPQLPTDIAIGRGHNGEYLTKLRAAIEAQADTKKPAASKVTAPSSSMKAPVPANGKLCRICYMEEHEDDVVAVGCDNDHFMCQPCFASWVESESDIDGNPQNILLNGGRITCVCKKSDDCGSLSFGNKLIATVVSDEIYEKYLRARDFVVGKEAVAGALSKINKGDMDAIEQEQIRNMYRTKQGSYSAYMCGECSFGPIDHGWCGNLSTHHGEKKTKSDGGVAVTSNACPKCGWFANNINDWPHWDGNFKPASFKPKAAQKPVSSMTVPMLKAALKLRGASCSGNKVVLAARLQALYDQEGTIGS
mmetsp:Transcript_33719/g.62324  ORF Transcript_33719/g.62324 Transcript_33719/m.62324 type:complete len:511 (-) Transcript_33719:169-1701(-)